MDGNVIEVKYGGADILSAEYDVEKDCVNMLVVPRIESMTSATVIERKDSL